LPATFGNVATKGMMSDWRTEARLEAGAVVQRLVLQFMI
jgi:hypothetical protein